MVSIYVLILHKDITELEIVAIALVKHTSKSSILCDLLQMLISMSKCNKCNYGFGFVGGEGVEGKNVFKLFCVQICVKICWLSETSLQETPQYRRQCPYMTKHVLSSQVCQHE